MPFGFNGKILHVDLTKQSYEVEQPEEGWYRTYMGGSAFASYYLLKMLKPGTDPLSPDNVLVFATSVVTGVPISGFNRYTVAAKSPLTGYFGESEAGGYFGPELKFAGFDALVITGRAANPVYLHIQDGEIAVKDAGHLWGLDNFQTLQALQSESGDTKIRVASIGQAGERLVRFANVSNDMEHFNGRTGMGAVMGSKNLKCIAVRGRQKMQSADPETVKTIAKWHNQRIKEHPMNVNLSRAGTPMLVKGLNAGGILPTRNFTYGVFDQADNISWDAYEKNIFHGTGTCWACSVKCKRKVGLDDDKYPLDPRWGGPEYEALAALGSLICNGNLPALARGNQLCNLYGLDVISAGNIVAFAMECFEAGILSAEDLHGSLEWGDADGMLRLIEMTATREGIGDTLAEGVHMASQNIGKGAQQFDLTIKNNDLPLHDGRGKTGMALGYALSSTGADHVETPHDPAFLGEGIAKLAPLGLHESFEATELNQHKARFAAVGQKAWGINNLLSICNFTSVPLHAMTFDKLVEAVRAITDWDTSLYEIIQAVDRSMVMSRMFNCREGLGPEEDRVIEKWHQPMPEGPLKGQFIEKESFQEAVKAYYEISGWDRQGVPTTGKLLELGLDWLI
jgi:aldehyde:ferredoxin oxidoreductase